MKKIYLILGVFILTLSAVTVTFISRYQQISEKFNAVSSQMDRIQNENTTLREINETLTRNVENLLDTNHRETGGNDLTDDLSSGATEDNPGAVEILQGFLRAFAYYDESDLRGGREELLRYATPQVADRLIPEALIEDLENESDHNHGLGGEGSHDAIDYVTNYISSDFFSRQINSHHYRFFAIINYELNLGGITSSLRHHIYVDVEERDGSFIVTDFQFVDVRELH